VAALVGLSRYVSPASLDSGRALAFYVLHAVFLWAAVVVILRELFQRKGVGGDNVLGAICGYLIAGAGWASLNEIAFWFDPTTFSINPDLTSLVADWQGRLALFLYYSLAQMMTIGYSDVTPLRAPATTLSLFAALFGCSTRPSSWRIRRARAIRERQRSKPGVTATKYPSKAGPGRRRARPPRTRVLGDRGRGSRGLVGTAFHLALEGAETVRAGCSSGRISIRRQDGSCRCCWPLQRRSLRAGLSAALRRRRPAAAFSTSKRSSAAMPSRPDPPSSREIRRRRARAGCGPGARPRRSDGADGCDDRSPVVAGLRIARGRKPCAARGRRRSGLAAAFNAPLAGAIFVFEELLRRFELRTAVSTLSACGAALVVMRVLLGDRLVFSVPPIVVELFPGSFSFLRRALSSAAGDRVQPNGRRRTRPRGARARHSARSRRRADRSNRRAGRVFRAHLGGQRRVGCAIGAERQPHARGNGRPVHRAPGAGTALLCTGTSGGLFAPLLAVGAAAGIIVGIACEAFLPLLSMPLAGYAAIGMGALFVAVVRAPLTAIALVVEMTGATEPVRAAARRERRRSRRAGDARLPADLRHAAGARRSPATAIGKRLTRRRRLRANCCLPDIAPVH
jgi:CIC family chloride channel protein